MSFITRFFSALLSRKEKSDLNIDLGKYTEQAINLTRTEKWENAEKLYLQKKYLEAYKNLLEYLLVPDLNNINYQVDNHLIRFELFQGSKKIIGKITEEEIEVYSDVVRYSGGLPTELMELLLQDNFQYNYSKFILTPETIRLGFNAPVSVVPPQILYQALKELSITADNYDDILIEKYKNFTPINTQHIIQLPEHQIETKIKYLRQWTKERLSLVEKLSRDKRQKEINKGTISYLLLSLIYKIYYLLAPEGVLLDYLRKLDSFFWNNTLDIVSKNDYLFTSLSDLAEWSDSEIAKSLYRVISTFSVVSAVDNAKIIDFISTELEGAKQYIIEGFPNLFNVVIEYIIGYLNFHIALKPLLKELLDVLWRIYNDNFFLDMGYSVKYVSRGKLNSFVIEYRINKIIEKHKLRGRFKISRIDFSSITSFSNTYLTEVINLLNNEK